MINRERLIHQFEALVSIDAESYYEDAMRDYLKMQLTGMGIDVEEDDAGEKLKPRSGRTGSVPGNLHAYIKGTLPGEPILFAAHMDTVRPGNGKKAVIHEDGIITSDGTTVLGADDEAALAEILEMLRTIKENHLEHRDIEIVFPVAEEPYAQGSGLLDYSRIRAKMAYCLDDSGPIGLCAPAAPAIIQYRIKVHGKAAHAGFNPQLGHNAIQAAALAITRIPQGHVDDASTVNIGFMKGGTAKNIVPDYVELEGEMRSMKNENAQHWEDVIRDAFASAAKEYECTVESDFEKMFSAYRTQTDEEVSMRYVQACENLGIPWKFEDTFGGSDNNHFSEHGIRGLVIACGMNNCHTVKEWTSVDDLCRAADLILQLAVMK